MGRILQNRSRYMSDRVYLLVLVFVTGLITGALAALLKWMIATVSGYLTVGLRVDGFNWWLLAVPLTGILLTGIYQRYIQRANLSHGVEQLAGDVKRGVYRLPGYVTYGPLVASTFTLGFGGSAGSEGPIAYTGAGVGSNVGKLLRVPDGMLRVLVACGAGAGIAGIFKAPIGGALFTLEVMGFEMTTMSVMALILCCVTASMTAYVLSGYTVDLSYIQMERFGSEDVVWIGMLGVVCGLYSLYYSGVMAKMRKVYERISNPWLRNATSGAVLAVLVCMFPAMYGEGYPVMGHMLNGDLMAVMDAGIFYHFGDSGWPIVLVVGGIVMTKCFAASASNSGGGVAGDFAPTLFAGCMLGFFFASLLNLWLGLGLSVSGFAFLGMAGVMSGAIRAPFMALFLTAEMTDGFILLLPLLAVSAISYGVVMLGRRMADRYRLRTASRR